MLIESLQQIEGRIAEIEDRIAQLQNLTAPAPSANGAFQQQIQSAMAAGRSSAGSQAPTDYDDIIAEAAEEYGLDPKLIRAMMIAESGGRPGATSRVGAMGLMQLMPATAKSLGVTDPYDPRQNIFGGARYLKGLIERLGSTELAVAAYNAGPGAVKRYGGIPPYAETQKYVAKVMKSYSGGEG